MKSDKVKFLIIRFSSIGDIVLTTPIIRGIKKQVENAEIHYFTKAQYAGILESNPYVHKVHVLSSFRESIKKLRDEKFDYIIDLHKNLRTYRFKNKLKVMDFSFPKLNWEKWLMVNFKINKLPDKHIVDRYYQPVYLFDVSNDLSGLDFFIPEQDYEVVSNILKTQSIVDFIAFGIGGQHYTKKLPDDMILKLCEKIDYPIVLLGGQEDDKTAQFIKKNCPNVINFCGKLNLSQSAEIIRNSKAVISHDTGLMHIAAAFKKDIISIWGNTIPEFGMYPYLAGSKSKMFEVKELKCRPCSKIGFKKCPKQHFKCMKNQDIGGIAEQAKSIVKSV